MINISNGYEPIIQLIENELENEFEIEETLLNLFEKKSMGYFNCFFNNLIKFKNREDESFNILKESICRLDNYINNRKNNQTQLKRFYKLFYLSYIKTYCYIHNIKAYKWEAPNNIIDVLNTNNSIFKMVRLYIYKILYNKYSIHYFCNQKNVKRYKLEEYCDFFVLFRKEEINDIYHIDYKVKTLEDKFYEDLYKSIEKKEKRESKNITQFRIDNFYISSYNSTLAYLQVNDSNIKENYYNNICQQLFNEKELLLKAIQLFYQPEKYKEIKRIYKINSNNIKPLIFGYRYCLNELSYENKNGIYYSLYNTDKLNYLNEKYYPGNDTKFNLVYSQIINHFVIKPEEGCYVCTCSNMYYHSLPSGFPGIGELNMKCPKCKGEIGSHKDRNVLKAIKRDNYYRIFKDEKEIKELIKDKKAGKRLKEIKFMTLEKYKEKYIYELFRNEKGIFKADKNNFRNDNKIVRNLSQISYRLLNYILYIHLFFARLITNKNDYDKYLPKDMTWTETLSECWYLLKNELLKINIDSIDEFMHYIFVELFPLLNKGKTIEKYKELIILEDKLESKIQELIKTFKDENNNLLCFNQENEDETSIINLLKEKYTSEHYKEGEFPFYKYFYYSDYLNENYLIEKLSHMSDNKYPVLRMYLDHRYNNDNNNLLNYLYLFNNALNLINQKYNIIYQEKRQKGLS